MLMVVVHLAKLAEVYLQAIYLPALQVGFRAAHGNADVPVPDIDDSFYLAILDDSVDGS